MEHQTSHLASAAPTPTHVHLIVKPIDMRISIEGISQHIQNTLGRTPCDGSIYAFRNRPSTRIKLLRWDGTGVWLHQRRLHRGHFIWPTPDTLSVTLTQEEWHWLTIGIDWTRLIAPPPTHWQF